MRARASQLLGTQFTESLGSYIETYLQTDDQTEGHGTGIPAFLAAVALALYGNEL